MKGSTWKTAVTILLVLAIVPSAIYSHSIAARAAYTFGRVFGDRSFQIEHLRIQLPDDAWILIEKSDSVALGFIRGFGDSGLIHIFHKSGEASEILSRPTNTGLTVTRRPPISIAGRQCEVANYAQGGRPTERAVYCPSVELLLVATEEQAWVWARANNLHLVNDEQPQHQ